MGRKTGNEKIFISKPSSSKSGPPGKDDAGGAAKGVYLPEKNSRELVRGSSQLTVLGAGRTY